MTVDLQELPRNVTEAADMLRPWLGKPNMLHKVFVQVDELATFPAQAARAKHLFRLAYNLCTGQGE